jgi:hypothetical protein
VKEVEVIVVSLVDGDEVLLGEASVAAGARIGSFASMGERVAGGDFFGGVA